MNVTRVYMSDKKPEVDKVMLVYEQIVLSEAHSKKGGVAITPNLARPMQLA